MRKILEKKERRERRKKRVRAKIFGTSSRPRASVFRSSKHLSVQIIDDTRGVTLSSASTLEKALNLRKNVEDARKLGKTLGERLQKVSLESVVFDRNGYRYHGLVQSLADGLRDARIKL